MSSAAIPRPMSADEFLVWRQGQEGTWEFVDGVPRTKFDHGPRMMAGGSVNHAQVASNLIVALRPRLRGGPCRPLGSDLAVRMPEGGLRQPDVTVVCGSLPGSDLQATEPKAVFEVLSPSRGVDLVRKADEHRGMPSLAHLVILEADRAAALLWTRAGDDWRVEEVGGLEGELALVGLGVSLPMAEVYEDVALEPGG